MTKQAEIDYFANMNEDARRYAGRKPFSADQRGAYLLDIGQIFSLIPPPPRRLLDLGCGSGWTTAMYAQAGYDALGVDLAPAAISLATGLFAPTGARFEVHDFEALPFSGRFDIAVIYDCLHHADREREVVKSVFRALAGGGEILVMEPGRGHHDSQGSQIAVQAHGVTEKDMPPSLTTRLLRAAGFADIRVFPRAQFQIAEREGTGGVTRRLEPLLGPRVAALVKTLKNSVFTGGNGVVTARKPAGPSAASRMG